MITVERTTDIEACLEIRRRVFIDEQQVTLAEEVDGLDPACEHFLARIDGVPVATAGFGHPDTRAHAPDENLRIDYYVKHAKHVARLLEAFGS